jgi:predicted phage terminase large subunit-like protein
LKFIEAVVKLDATFKADWYHVRLAEEADKFVRKERSYIASLPPGSGKSALVVLLAAFILLMNPRAHIIFVCNSQRLASVMLRSVIRILLSPAAQAINPLTFSKQTESEVVIDCVGQDGRPSLLAAGAGTVVTGHRADYVIADDLIADLQQALSGECDTIWENFNSVLETRLLPDGCIWLQGTRWAISDPSGRALKRAKENALARQWIEINFAAWNDGKDSFIRNTATGEVSYLKPYRSLASRKGLPYSFSRKQYEAKRANLGPLRFSAMYMGQPVSEDAQLFPPTCWTFVDQIHTDDYQLIATSWDTSSGAVDPSANIIIGRRNDGGFTVLDVWEERLTFSRLLPVILERYRKLSAEFRTLPLLVVEDASSGREIADVIRTSFPDMPLVASKPLQSKFLRAEGISHITAAGSVALYSRAPWVDRFVRTFANFPSDKTDDHLPDAFSQCLKAFVGSGQDFRTPDLALMPGRLPSQSEQEQMILEAVKDDLADHFITGFTVGREDW